VNKIAYLSDISAIVTLGKNGFDLHAFRLSDTSNLDDAQITLYSENNEILFQGKSDKSGNLSVNLSEFDQKKPKSIYIKSDDEENFIVFEQAINGVEMSDESKNRALIYLTSEILRPNEKLEGVIIAKNESYEPIKNLPLKVKIFDPKHRIFKEFSKTADEFGLIELNEELSENTGIYTINVEFEGKNIAKKSFSVEAFTPNQVKSEILANKSEFIAGENPEISLIANYFFGDPAANLRANLVSNYSEIVLNLGDFKDFSFVNKLIYNPNLLKSEKIDFTIGNDGTKSLILTPNTDFKVSNALNLGLNLSVLSGNRNSNEYKNLTIYPHSALTGIKSSTDYAISGTQTEFSTVSLEPITKERLSRNLNIKIYQKDWQIFLFDSHFDENDDYILVDSFETNTSNFTYNFTQGGEYLIVANDYAAGSSASCELYVAGNYGQARIKNDKITETKVILDKKEYKSGDEMSVSLSSIIDEGVAYVVFGSKDEIYAKKIVNVKNGKADVSFRIPPKFAGAHVMATVFREAKNLPTPLRTYGVAEVKANSDDKKMNLALNLPISAKNGEEIHLKISANPNSEVAVFIVDEGVLDIIKQREINAFDYFNVAKRNQMRLFDIFSDLSTYFSEAEALKFGSDRMLSAKAMLKNDMSPIKAKNIETFKITEVAKTNDNGELEIVFKTPNAFNSQLRITAIALNGEKIASANKYMNIKDDIVLKAGAITYITQGDELNLPLNVINTTNEEQNLTLKAKTSDNVHLNIDQISFALKPLSNLRIHTKLKALNLGDANISVEIANEKEKFTNVSQFSVLSQYPLSHFEAAGYSNAQTVDLALNEAYKKAAVSVSKSPAVLLSAYTEYLLQYPHGCTEQLTSKLLALDNLYANGENSEKRAKFRDEAIANLISRLRNDGSFSYWRAGAVNEFASIYASDVLLGVNQKQNFMTETQKERILGFLKQNFDDNFLKLYAAFVLSENGALETSQINYLLDNKLYEFGYLGQYLMAAILKNAAMQGEFEQVFGAIDFNKKGEYKQKNFDSDTRNWAFALYIHSRIAKADEKSQFLIDNLVKNLNVKSTQSKAFILRAFRSFFDDDAPLNFALKINGKELHFSETLDEIFDLKSAEIGISSETDFYYSVASFGYEALPLKNGFDNQKLDIYREFVDANSLENIDLNGLKIGDQIYSKVAVRAGNFYTNVLVDEQISSCFEVVNERISGTQKQKQMQNQAKIEYQDIKNERVVSFLAPLRKGEIYYIYTPLRVVLSGECALPAVRVEYMQDENIANYAIEAMKFRVNE